MSSQNAEIVSLRAEVSRLSARLVANDPNQMVPATIGFFAKYGCKVTEGSDATDMVVKLEGQASGDSANLNPKLSATPSAAFQYPNIASCPGGMFRSADTTATVTAVPSTGTGRYDIAYIFQGKDGGGFQIAAGTASAAVKTDFDTNGLQTADYGEGSPDYDPALPAGALAVARIYVEDDVTGIPNARIADIRNFTDSLHELSNATLTNPTVTGTWTAAGATCSDLGTVTTADINGGTVDATIGATTPAPATVTTLDSQVGAAGSAIISTQANTNDSYFGLQLKDRYNGSPLVGAAFMATRDGAFASWEAVIEATTSTGSDAVEVARFGSSGISVDSGSNYINSTRAALPGFLNLGPNSELTISAGVITASGSFHAVDTESDAASDDLDTINGGASGDILVLRSASAARAPTLKDGTGNLLLNGDFALNNLQDKITLIKRGSNWEEVSRSDNA